MLNVIIAERALKSHYWHKLSLIGKNIYCKVINTLFSDVPMLDAADEFVGMA